MSRDIVSGDFYWAAEVKHASQTYVVTTVVDCTGHGVPGAFLSMVGCNVLNHLVKENKMIEPSQILTLLDQEVRRTLQQGKDDSKEGMDMAIITLTRNDNSTSTTTNLFSNLMYSGAMNPLYYVQQGILHEIKATKLPIGGEATTEKTFITHTIPITEPTTIYLCSDGYQDQFGGKRNKKFMVKKLRELLGSLAHLPMTEQHNMIARTFETWKGQEDQVDDITVMGVQV